jgi:phage-related protein
MRRSTTITLLFSALLSLAGCKSPCRELSERLCNCVQQFQRDDCITLVADRERTAEPDDAQLEFCEQKLETCDPRPLEDETNQSQEGQVVNGVVLSCSAIETDEGKVACGLAR